MGENTKEKFENFIKQKGYKKNYIANLLGITHVGLSKKIENNTFSVSDLNRLKAIMTDEEIAFIFLK